MKFRLVYLTAAAMALGLSQAAAEATGDADAGAKVFAKCQTCHVVADAEGNVLAGRNSKTGPNLYGLPGRVAGTYDGFNYGESIVAMGAGGYAWDEEGFVAYVANPVGFLREKTGDKSAKSKMSFKLPKEEDARNVYAFIASLSPAADAAAPAEGEAAPASN